ncbi:MAG: transporter [Proteobacteria bacterium]|nr:transporter [Pseudomonadota bacterium]
MKLIVLIAIYVILNSCGQLLIKMGTLELPEVTGIYDLFNLKLIAGIGLFGMSFLTWIYILSKNNLSYAFPFAVGLGYMAVIFLSIFVLKETSTYLQLTGIGFVWMGIILMSVQGG